MVSIQIPLISTKSPNQFAVVDEDDWELIASYEWRTYAKRGVPRYAVAHSHGESIYMHRLILGVTDTTIHVDHKDDNGFNNCRSNIRIATYAENDWNKGPQRNNQSGFKGVYWGKQRKRWVANISANKKRVVIGFFYDIHEAARAYDRAAIELHGEFARLNFPES